MNSQKIIEDQIRTYRENFLKNKNSPLGTFQNNRETQYLRFERIIRPFLGVLDEKCTLHDLGCGVCDLHQYLLDKKIPHVYSGTEVLDEMIDHATKRFPRVTVLKRDVLKEKTRDSYDIVVFSGGLYLPGTISKDEWKEFVFRILDKMFAMCKTGISFNLLSTYCSYQDDGLFYLDPKEMFDYCCRKYSRFVSLDQSYPLYEWTIAVFREEFIRKKYPEKEFKKYFSK